MNPLHIYRQRIKIAKKIVKKREATAIAATVQFFQKISVGPASQECNGPFLIFSFFSPHFAVPTREAISRV